MGRLTTEDVNVGRYNRLEGLCVESTRPCAALAYELPAAFQR